MRYLFIFLLALNISYLIWGVAFSGKKEQISPEVQVKSINTLILLNERPDKIKMGNFKQSSEEEEVDKMIVKKHDKKISSKSCFSIGPIHEEKELKKLEEMFKKAGIISKPKTVVGKEAKSFWVYIPPAKTMEDANSMADELKYAKVQDYFVIRTGKNAKAISLGLYNGYRRAKIRQENITKIGFNAKVKTRYKEVAHFWIDIQQNDANLLKDELWNKEANDFKLQKIPLPCVDPLPENI